MEISAVTPAKAPELLATFNVAYMDLSKMVTLLDTEVVWAKRTADKIKSVVILDRAPVILMQKGLVNAKNPAGSADLRDAVLLADEEYLKATDTLNTIETFRELLKGKLKGIEMAYTSVKKILGETNAHNYGSGARLPAGNEGNAQAGHVVAREGFGKARL